MPYKQVPVGKPDRQVLEEFFDGTIPTPNQLEARAIKLAAKQKAANAKAAAKVNARGKR